jgi:hypothetical protein
VPVVPQVADLEDAAVILAEEARNVISVERLDTLLVTVPREVLEGME